MNHQFAAFVPTLQVLAAADWVLCENLHLRRSPCWLIITFACKVRLRHLSLWTSCTRAERSAEWVRLPTNDGLLSRHIMALSLLDLVTIRNIELSSTVPCDNFLDLLVILVDSFTILYSCFLGNIIRGCGRYFELGDFSMVRLTLEHLVWVWYHQFIFASSIVFLCQLLLSIIILLQ